LGTKKKLEAGKPKTRAEISCLRRRDFVRYITDVGNKKTYGNATASACAAGFGHNGTGAMKQIGYQILHSPAVQKEISEIFAERRRRSEWNYDTAAHELVCRMEYLEEKAKGGDCQAISAQTAILRELNAISGLHVQELKHEIVPVERLEPADDKKVLEERLDRLRRLEAIPDAIQR